MLVSLPMPVSAFMFAWKQADYSPQFFKAGVLHAHRNVYASDVSVTKDNERSLAGSQEIVIEITPECRMALSTVHSARCSSG
jgi:hypothetical protein